MPVHEYYGKNNKRTWYVEAFLGIDPETGKKIIEKKRGFTTKREALAYETEILFKKNNKTIVKPSSKLLSELLAEWLKVKRRENEIGEQTWQVYDTNIRIHINPCIGNVKLSKLNVLHIEKLMDQLDEKGLASGTRKKIYNIMNNALSEAVRKKEVAENVVALVKKPKVTYKKIEVWDKETVKRFVTDAKGLSRYYMAYYLPLFCGLRQGEVLGLRWRDIDFNKRVLRIQQTLSHDGKKLMPGAKSTAGIRSVALSKSTIAALLEHREMIYNERAALGEAYVDNDLVICTEKGTPALPRDIMKRWKKLLAKLNIRYITYHSCRHTAASLLLLANIHPKVVSEMLGHASVRLTLDIYSHLLPNMQDEAVNKVDSMMEEEDIELEATVSEEALEASDTMDNLLEDN